MPRGVTLLELLIVLVLMTVAAALVLPTFRARPAEVESAQARVIATARRSAIRRAEPLRVRLFGDGAWSIRSQRDGALVDSGSVREALPSLEMLVDPLGSCIPVGQSAAVVTFDPLSCLTVAGGSTR
jgi:prepilin-type N-terminal cleavage/methylation domain-containing protein